MGIEVKVGSDGMVMEMIVATELRGMVMEIRLYVDGAAFWRRSVALMT
jgi:hypothetical protein